MEVGKVFSLGGSGGGGVASVTGTSNRISIGGTATDPTVDISATYVGQTSITTLGTIATGVWQGTAIGDSYIASALTGKTYNGLTITSSTGTLTITNGKTLSVSNILTFTGTDSSSVAFGAGGTVLYVPGATYTTTTGDGFALTTSTLTTGNLVKLSSTGTAAGSSTQTVLNIATSGANGTSAQTTYGLYVANTHTGTTSVNVGGYFKASGGASANNAGIFWGNIGQNTDSPGVSGHSTALTGSVDLSNNVYQTYAIEMQGQASGGTSEACSFIFNNYAGGSYPGGASYNIAAIGSFTGSAFYKGSLSIYTTGGSGLTQGLLVDENQRCVIGSNGTINNSATLKIDDSSRGFMPNQGTTTQRNAVTAVEGLLYYDLTLHGLFLYDGTNWVQV